MACTFPSLAHANAIPANVDPISMAHMASSFSRHATNFLLFAPINSKAFSAIASENGDASRDT